MEGLLDILHPKRLFHLGVCIPPTDGRQEMLVRSLKVVDPVEEKLVRVSLLAMKRTLRKASASNDDRTSMCTELVLRQVEIYPGRFTDHSRHFLEKRPKQSTPV